MFIKVQRVLCGRVPFSPVLFSWLATALLLSLPFAVVSAQTRKPKARVTTPVKSTATPAATPAPQNAAEHGYRVGYEDGYIRGRSDFNDKKDRYPEDAAAYKSADRNYEAKMGSLAEFQSGYRSGFELGYDDGYFGRVYNIQTPYNLGQIVAVQQRANGAGNAPEITVSNVPAPGSQPAPASNEIPANRTARNPEPASAPSEQRTATTGTDRRTRRGEANQGSVMPEGTQMKIRLQTAINSKTSREGDPFEATVLDPAEFAQARVTGHIAKLKNSGKMAGKTELVLAFDTIELRNGQRSRFAAQIERIYESDSVKEIDDEGNVATGDRKKDTAIRTGGGAVLGAVLGGAIGGGAGAAIGAAVGAAAGAGSVIYQGSKNIELQPGTEMLIRTANPTTTNEGEQPPTMKRTRN